MKLFVFPEFQPDWWTGLAFAIAENESDARKLIQDNYGSEVYEWGVMEVHELNAPIGFGVSGGG